jgi:hypothetical protein
MNNEDNIPRDNDSIPSDRTSDAGSGLFSFEVINNIDDVDQLPAADPLDLAQDPQVPAVIADPQLAAPPVANPQVVAIGGQAAAVQANPLPAVPPVVNPQAQVVQFAGVPQVPGVQPHVGGPAPNFAAQPGNVPPPPQVAGNHPPTPIHHGPSPIITMNIGNTNPSTSSGAQLVTRFLTSPFEQRLTISPLNHPIIMAALKHRLQQFGVTLTRIPLQGTGQIPYLPNFSIGHLHPDMDLSGYVDILDSTSERPSLDQIMAYASWFNNDNTGLLSVRSSNDMIQRYVNPYTKDNYGRVSAYKIERRREDAAVFALIDNILTVQEMDRMALFESKYKFTIEGSPNNFHHSGLVLLGIIFDDASPPEQLDSEILRNEFNALTFESCGYNIKTFKAKLDIKAKQIEAIERTLFDQTHYGHRYFDELGKYPQAEWRHEFLNQRGAYRSGRSLLDCHTALVKVYNELVHNKTWTNLPLDPHKQIAMLTTEVQQLKQDNNRLKSGVTPTNIASDKGISPWQRTYTTPTVIHPTKTAANGRKLELTWCPKCGPGRTAGNPSGLYMEPFNGKPHNHDEWLEAKIAKSRNRFNVNKRKVSGDVVKKSDIVTATIDKSFTPHNSAKKQRLKIRENLIKSLTTNVSLSVDEAEKIADESGAVASPAHLKE